MRPSRLLYQQSPSHLCKEKFFQHKYSRKKQKATYDSMATQLITTDQPRRSNSSEVKCAAKSSSFKQIRVQNKNRLSYSITARPKRKTSQEQHVRVRYYRSEGKEEDQAERTRSNPWGGPPIAKRLSPGKSSKEKLQEQRKSLQRLADLRASQEGVFMASSVIKYKAKGPTKIQKITKRAIPDYLSFIHGEGSYTLGFDFSFLRGLNRSEALKSVDVGMFRVLESIWLCTLDIIRDSGSISGKGASKLLRQYSFLYFRLFEKILVEFVLYYHVFKLCQSKIIQYLVNSRLCMLILHETALEQASATNKYRPLLDSAVTLMVAISKILYEGQVQGSPNYVTDTLKNLKLTTAAEKKIGEMSGVTHKLVGLMSGNTRVERLLKELSPLIKEVNMGGLQLQFLAQTQCFLAWEFFVIPPIPYLSPKQPDKPYTLILTLDYTLVFLDPHTRMVQYRPYLDHFLQKISTLFEVVVWTDQEQVLADIIIDSIERVNKIFSFRLYSEHFSLVDGVLGRDLTRLGRPTQRTLILESNRGDEKAEKGLLLVKAFEGDQNDSQLLRVLARLEWMTQGFPKSIIQREPLHLSTLEHIEEEIEQGNTISTH